MKKIIAERKYFWPAVTAGLVFLIYLASTGSGVSFYRDSGELITSAYTLSVAHSPGYPVYMLLGKLFIEILGLFRINPAYSMNIFSALAGAAGIYYIILSVREITGNSYISVFAGLITAFTYINWLLAVVAEMYSLSFFFGAFLLYLMIKRKYSLFGFVFGLSLGNHLSILFAVIPMAAALYFFMPAFKKVPLKSISLYFVLGLAIYAYLPVRASSGSFINWGNPSNIERFWEVVSRSAYGHTLDLVSREVTLTQVYMPQLRGFFAAILRDITFPGIIFSLLGIYYGFKERRFKKISFVLAAIFMLTGPYFLYLARMPVNPHANAIIEVGYIFPEMVLAIFSAFGLFFIAEKIKIKNLWIFGASFLIIIYAVFNIYPKADKRNKYFADDYAVNILNTVDKKSIVIMRRDHTLFALWYKIYVENFRPEVKVISKGLLSAEWYRDKLRKDFPAMDWKEEYLNDKEYIEWIIKNYGKQQSVYITPAAAAELDKEFFSRYEVIPYGLVEKVVEKDMETEMRNIVSETIKKYKYRGSYNTSGHYDYFARDFITLYAEAHERIGTHFLRDNNSEDAQKMYRRAIDFSPELPGPYANLAYLYWQEKNLDKAVEFYRRSIELLKDKMAQFTRKEAFKRNLAGKYNNLGAVYEKKYRLERENRYFNNALESYNNAIRYDRNFSRPYFNLGVLYWNRDWGKAAENFRLAAKFDPSNRDALKYYKLALKNAQNLRKSP